MYEFDSHRKLDIALFSLPCVLRKTGRIKEISQQQFIEHSAIEQKIQLSYFYVSYFVAL